MTPDHWGYTHQVLVVLNGCDLRGQLLDLFVIHCGGDGQVIHRHGPERHKEGGTER